MKTHEYYSPFPPIRPRTLHTELLSNVQYIKFYLNIYTIFYTIYKTQTHPILNSQVCVIVYVNFCHCNTAFLFSNSLFQPRAKDLTGTTPPKKTQQNQRQCCFSKGQRFVNLYKISSRWLFGRLDTRFPRWVQSYLN